MTLEEATEAGLLVKALEDLSEDRRSTDEVPGDRIGFDDDLYLPRALYIAMTEFGLSYALSFREIPTDAAILRAQKATSTDAARLEREARMAEVSERERLRLAIAVALEHSKGFLPVGGVQNVLIPAEAHRTILAAAEKHLATLPKPKFMVRVWKYETMHGGAYERGYYESHDRSTRYDAVNLAYEFFQRGARRVEILETT